jgi:predicted Abi (CAAX) family protease
MFSKVCNAMLTWPDGKGWLGTLLLFSVFAAIAVPVASANNFLNPALPLRAWLPMLFTTFFIPATLEELVWRVVLVPRPGTKYFWHYGLGVTVFYVFSHPLGAWLFRPAARDVFYSSAFLFLAALLALTCLVAYARTKSLWSCVLIHWLTVATWLLLGGRRLLET